MAVWLVKATWIEDEVEATEQWEVNADTAHDAVREVTAHIRFQPHHVEVRLRPPDDESALRPSDLHPRTVRRVPPQ